MNSSFQYFSLHKNNNDDREMRGIILDNGIKIALISDKKIIKSCCSVGVGIGSLHDSHEGIAHFLEHLLFMGNEKYKNQNDYHAYVKNSGGYDNAYTSDEETCYFLILESKFLKKGIEMLSWFFKAPLLQECHVESERNIVNSEHEKNILSDLWIEDSLSKNFFTKDNKYRRFSTGNNKSLKNVTHKDAYNFYKEYYTTDNLFVCIIDSQDLDYMEKNYVQYFKKIDKSSHNKSQLGKIEFVDDNFIIYESISNYVTLDVKIFFDYDKHNLQDKSIINFLLFILFTKFTKSLSYYLLEEKLVYDINNEMNVLYEKYCILTLELYFEQEDKEIIINKMKKSLDLINECLTVIENLSEKEFNVLYENYINIIKLNYYFNKNKDVSDISLEVTNNMLNSINDTELNNSIIDNELRSEFTTDLYKKYKKIILSRKIKLITNLNVFDLDLKEYKESEWYNAKYYMNRINNFYKFNKFNNEEIIKLKNKFNFKNLLEVEFNSADNLLQQFRNEKKIKNNSIPQLIYNENKIKRKIYLVRGNNYDSPSSAISIIKKNNQRELESQIIFTIYEEIFSKILVYYLEVESLYLSNFDIKYKSSELIYNFKGITELSRFIKKIIENISYKTVTKNNKFEEYYNLAIKVFLQILENEKHNPPFSICQKYFEIHTQNDMKENQVYEFLESLTLNKFKEKLKKLLEYEDEYIIIFANTIIKSDNFISEINDAVPTYKDLIIPRNKSKKTFNFNKNNYTISKSFITPAEINNCVLDFYLLKEIDFEYLKDDILEKKTLIGFLKYSLISDFLVELLTDKLFDKLRTIEKLGYIVRASKNQTIKNGKILIGFSYLVQSTFTIERIQDSINEFNNVTIQNINFKRDFENLKQNKIILLNKDFETFDQEAMYTIGNMSMGTHNYNMKSLFIKVCEKITYSQIIKVIRNIPSLNNTKVIIDVKSNN